MFALFGSLGIIDIIYEVNGRFRKLTFFSGSEHPGFAGNKLMAGPPKPLTPVRRKPCSSVICTSDMRTFVLPWRLFPITAKAPNAPVEGLMQQPAVHIDLGIPIASLEGLSNLSVPWIASSPLGPLWMLASEMPVIKYKSPPFGLHVLVAYSLFLFSYWAHWPLLNTPICGTALV